MTNQVLHPMIVAAAQGDLPDWACVASDRRPHLAAVAEVMDTWAAELGLDEPERVRWNAAGWLHDALRDADPDELAAEAGGYPPKVRHGPAVAARLRAAGVEDEELLEAVAYHTVGRGGLGRLGRYLYLADYLEPGRTFKNAERTALVRLLPQECETVLRSVCALRIAHLLDCGIPLPKESVDFWNDLAARP